MRHVFLCLSLAGGIFAAGLMNQTALAQAPAAAQSTDPAATQPAPEPEPPKPAWMEYHNPYTATETDLSNPHRTTDEIIAWAQQQITTSMSFETEKFNEKVTGLRTNFTDSGWRDYVTYLKSSQMVDMVRGQHYNVTTIINGDSLIINSGPVAGTYHWLVESPILISFTSKDDKGMPVTVAGGNFKIDIQLGRVESGGTDGMAIESWHVENAPSTLP